MIRKIYIGIIVLLFLFGCSDSKDETQKRTSPRIKKSTKIESPTQNQEFIRGEVIPITIVSNSDLSIDSIQISVGSESQTYTESSFKINLPEQQVGTWRILAKVYCGGETETHYRKIIVLPENAPEEYTYSVVNTIPHDVEDYTQGLLINDGILYESTGQRGESTLKKKNLLTGETEATINLATNLFGEGLAILNNKLYQLTWTAGKVFIYDLELNQIGSLAYQTEGWGLVSYKDQLIMTDGTEKLYFVDPASFTVVKEIEVYTNEGKIEALNELEMVGDLLYANVYQEDFIIVIDPTTGEVVQKIDFTNMLTTEEQSGADVLNGIAFDEQSGKLYITGKWWPKLFEVTIEPKPIQQ